MRSTALAGLLAILIGVAAGTAPLPASAGECRTIGAIGTGLTEGIARFMAEAGLKNLMNDKGLKRTGPVKVSCAAGTIMTECSARQQGCK